MYKKQKDYLVVIILCRMKQKQYGIKINYDEETDVLTAVQPSKTKQIQNRAV